MPGRVTGRDDAEVVRADCDVRRRKLLRDRARARDVGGEDAGRAPGVVYENNGVRVTAIEVNHGEKIRPAFGYVIAYDGKTVVLSGDTKPDPRIVRAASGADLLIHEVAIIDPELVKDYPSYRAIEDHHTSPEDAGRIFTEARPKLAVYSHIVFATKVPVQEVPEDALLKRTRSTYAGPLVIGRDLMSFVVSDTVQAFAPNSNAAQPLAP